MRPPGPVEAFLPVVTLAILFGLSMDYQVFLVSRMNEEWVHGRRNSDAVRTGQVETDGSQRNAMKERTARAFIASQLPGYAAEEGCRARLQVRCRAVAVPASHRDHAGGSAYTWTAYDHLPR